MPLLLNHLLKINLNMTESPSLPLLLRRWNLKRELKMADGNLSFFDLSFQISLKNPVILQPSLFFNPFVFLGNFFPILENFEAKGKLFEEFFFIPKGF